jgi:hypothetical protein
MHQLPQFHDSAPWASRMTDNAWCAFHEVTGHDSIALSWCDNEENPRRSHFMVYGLTILSLDSRLTAL